METHLRKNKRKSQSGILSPIKLSRKWRGKLRYLQSYIKTLTVEKIMVKKNEREFSNRKKQLQLTNRKR